MKEYILLKSLKNNYYMPMKIDMNIGWRDTSLSSLLFGDFRPWDKRFLTQVVSCYNVSFIYHDFENKMLYIGFSEWELSDGEMHCPDDEEFPDYVNETNSCKINVDNYLEFRKKWVELKQQLPSFAIIYRDDNDWVDCKGFETQAEMESFIKNYQPEAVH